MAYVIFKEEIEKIVKKYIELVKKEINIRKAYLYGSYINGNFTEDSDIDIAIVADDFIGDIVEDTFRLMKIRRKVDNRIEPHPFKTSDFDLSNPYIKEIVDTGVRIL